MVASFCCHTVEILALLNSKRLLFSNAEWSRCIAVLSPISLLYSWLWRLIFTCSLYPSCFPFWAEWLLPCFQSPFVPSFSVVNAFLIKSYLGPFPDRVGSQLSSTALASAQSSLQLQSSGVNSEAKLAKKWPDWLTLLKCCYRSTKEKLKMTLLCRLCVLHRPYFISI